MAKSNFIAPRIDTNNPTRLKRDTEETFISVQENFNSLQDSVPSFYTLTEPENVAPLSQVLVHKDFWTPETLTSNAAVFIRYVDPLPESLLAVPDFVDPATGYESKGYWIKLYEIAKP